MAMVIRETRRGLATICTAERSHEPSLLQRHMQGRAQTDAVGDRCGSTRASKGTANLLAYGAGADVCVT